MRTLVVIVLVASVAVAAGKQKVRTVDGKRVRPEKAFAAHELIEVRNLRFWSCRLADEGDPCTVVTGTLVSHLGHQTYTVLVDIEMYEILKGASHPQARGTLRATVHRPKPNVPTPFKAVGPAWLLYDGDKERTINYILKTSFHWWRPPKPPDPAK